MKTIKIYARISKDKLRYIIDWDESPVNLAKRWNTTAKNIHSHIAHHKGTWERIVIQDKE